MPGVALRIGFSYDLGRQSNSESCSEETPEFQELLRESPFFYEEALKGLYVKVLLSKHRSIACPLPLALASDLPCGVCTCKWDLQLLSPGWLWTDFPRPRGWRVTTALDNSFPCENHTGQSIVLQKSLLFAKSPFG